MDCVVSKQKPFSVEGLLISQKLRKLSKMVKPVLKLLSKRSRTNAVTPSCCNYEVEETQNKLNEAEPFDLEFRFHEDENARNEALENRLRESVSRRTAPSAIQTYHQGVPRLQPVVPGTYFAVPVQFVEAPTGGFVWVPLPDSDFAPHDAVTESQLPSQQVPCILV